jgi:hypothetical protein
MDGGESNITTGIVAAPYHPQDDFGDDPFDDCPPQTLQAFEESAILASQRPPKSFNNNGFYHQEEIVNLDDYPRSFAMPARHATPPVPRPQPSTQSVDLQALVQRLEKENLALKASSNQAHAQAQTKTGEVTILRKRLEKSTRDYEARLDTLRKSHQSTQAQSKLDLESVRKEREKIETDKKFLEHDFVARVRQPSKKPLQPSNKQHQNDSFKHKLPFGDGFDDGQMLLVSPRKNRANVSFDSAPSTPHQRTEKKRKRFEDSPAHPHNPLPLQDPSPIPSPWHSFTPLEESANVLPILSASTNKAQFLQDLLEFRIEPSGERLLEIMATHRLPSDPRQTLSNLLLDKISQSPVEQSSPDVASEFIISISSIWAQCLQEEYYLVVDVIIKAINHVFASSTYHFIQEIVLFVLPSAMKTIDLVVFPIVSRTYNESQGILDESSPPPNIAIDACFVMVEIMAFSCRNYPDQLDAFWKLVNIRWVLCLLIEAQPLHHAIFICNLLRSSAQPNTFGPIWKQDDASTANDQAEIESLVIERLTALLSQLPAKESKEPLTTLEILSFRLTVIHTLQAMTVLPRDGASIAKHEMAIGRIIKFLYHVIDLLYSPTTYPDDTHRLAITCVNTTMRLLYHTLTRHATKIDLREKLKMVKGGAHLHLIALTRLAFCESIVLEKGIDPAVSDAAHALLDEFLSPVEGEQLLKMFPSADSTGMFAQNRIDNMEEDTELEAKMVEEGEADVEDDVVMQDDGTKQNPMEID